MAARPDPNATQPLSGSQLVEITPAPPTGMNDQSIAWRGKVVSADEFATTPAKRSHAGALALALLAVAGLGGGAYYYFAVRCAPVVATRPIDAAVAMPATPIDAAIAAAPPDVAQPAAAPAPAAKPIHEKHAIRHHK